MDDGGGKTFAKMEASSSHRMQGLRALWCFYKGMHYCLWQKGNYAGLSVVSPSKQARLQIYWLALSIRIWDEPHYRSGTFQNDLRKNLRNVAVPKTGIPLSWFCHSKILATAFVLIVFPLLCLAAAIVRRINDGTGISKGFATQLLEPQDWFAFWRLNCVLASYYALCAGAEGFDMEDKLTFLESCEARGIAASPWLKVPPKLICKHRNEEGGLGFAAFSNAASGGEWILQPALENEDAIAQLLPANAPLSTIRIVTSSRAALKGKPNAEAMPTDITALSACWRAGRAGAATDHSSVLFDVDLDSGALGEGTTNGHWYRLGLCPALRCPWDSGKHKVSEHPDSGVRIAGETIADIASIRALVLRAHLLMCPSVPLVGWDVALTTHGRCLLEGNLSCNFFTTRFDRQRYFAFVEDCLSYLESKEGASNRTNARGRVARRT